jgi:hypothetical protein
MRRPGKLEHAFAAAVLMVLSAAGSLWHVQAIAVEPAAALHAKYDSLRNALLDTGFRRPIHIDSRVRDGSASGDVYAVVDYPFAMATAALATAPNWCDVLILHFNVKFCQVGVNGNSPVLDVRIGRKFDQPLRKTYQVNFTFREISRSPQFLHVQLGSAEGPLNTSNYRIVLQAAPVTGGRTFIQLSYAYDFGTASELAMKAYLATLGRKKVGFSVEGEETDGQPRYVDGMRGAIERNAMRYYLAIEAYLGALSVPSPQQVDRRLSDWFDASERYPLQLREMEREEYLEMKRREIVRQQSAMLTSLPPVAGRQ